MNHATTMVLALCVIASLVPAARSQSTPYVPLTSVLGPSIEDYTGWVVSFVPDLTGDGVPDVLEGNPTYRASPTSPIIGCAAARSGVSLGMVWQVNGAPNSSIFGREVIALGDLDLDGIPEVGVGDPSTASNSWDIYSGNTGSHIQTLTSTAAIEGFGWLGANVGDINADGVSDFAVGDIHVATGAGSGQVIVYSGVDRAMLGVIKVPGSANLGSAIAPAGDQNLDGVPDFVLGDRSADASVQLTDAGALRIISGATLAIGSTVLGTAKGEFLGQNVAYAGDISGDGIPELITTAQKAPTGGFNYLEVVTGGSGVVLWSRADLSTSGQADHTIAGGGDVNRDGVPDVVVGCPNFNQFNGRILILNGSTSSVIREAPGYSNFGYCVATGFDITSDGIDDVLVGSPGVTSPNTIGAMHLFSGFCAKMNGPWYPACTAGSLIMPTLQISGCVTSQASVVLAVTGAELGSAAILLAGSGIGLTPTGYYCGLRLTGILPILIPVPLSNQGGGMGVSRTASVPIVPYPFSVSLQGVFLNPSYQDGYATTNTLTIPFE